MLWRFAVVASTFTGRSINRSINLPKSRSTTQTPARHNLRHASTLIIGDGDLSYGRRYTERNAEAELHDRVVVSVLETQSIHSKVYSQHKKNVQGIVSSGGEVMFNVDATDLKASTLKGEEFDRVLWNFPHWPGKTNIRRNRELMEGFFTSVTDFMSPDGEVRVALVDGQGGMGSQSPREWKASWKVGVYAAENDLMLVGFEDFRDEVNNYTQSSYRGGDRSFSPGKMPEQYIFKRRPNEIVEERARLAVFHELHVMGGADVEKVEGIVKEVVPGGVDVNVGVVEWVGELEILVFRIVYSGVGRCIKKSDGDEWRKRVEERAEREGLVLRDGKKGMSVSHVVPYSMCKARFEL